VHDEQREHAQVVVRLGQRGDLGVVGRQSGSGDEVTLVLQVRQAGQDARVHLSRGRRVEPTGGARRQQAVHRGVESLPGAPEPILLPRARGQDEVGHEDGQNAPDGRVENAQPGPAQDVVTGDALFQRDERTHGRRGHHVVALHEGQAHQKDHSRDGRVEDRIRQDQGDDDRQPGADERARRPLHCFDDSCPGPRLQRRPE